MEHQGSFISDNRHQETMGSKKWQQQQTDERSDQSHSSRQRQHNSVRQVSTEVPVHKAHRVDMPFPVKPVYHRRTLCLGTQGSLNPHQLEKPSAPQPRGINNAYSGKTCNKKPMECPLLSQQGALLSNYRDVPIPQQPKRDLHRLSTEEEIFNTKVIMYEKLCRIGGKLRENSQRERASSGDIMGERHNRGQGEQDKGRQKVTMAPSAERRSRESVRGTDMSRYEKTPEDLRPQRKDQVERNEDRNKSVREEEWNRRGGGTTERATVKKQQPTRGKRAEEEVTGGHQQQQDREPDRRRETKCRDEQNRKSSRGEEKSEVGDGTRDNSHSGRQKTKGRGQAERISEEDEEDTKLNGERNQERSRHRTNRDEVEHSLRERPDSSKQLMLVPCKICSRKFMAERLEKHLTVCKKIQQSQRKVYDMSSFRAKGTQNEEFLKTNTRSKSPEMKSKRRQKHQPMTQMIPDYVTCPHCTRRFAPNAAERHIPMCQNIKSRPPPPRCRK